MTNDMTNTKNWNAEYDRRLTEWIADNVEPERQNEVAHMMDSFLIENSDNDQLLKMTFSELYTLARCSVPFINGGAL